MYTKQSVKYVLLPVYIHVQSVVEERASLASESSLLKEKLAIVEEKLEFSEEGLEKLKELNAKIVDENKDYMSEVTANLWFCILLTLLVRTVQILENREKVRKLEGNLKQQVTLSQTFLSTIVQYV